MYDAFVSYSHAKDKPVAAALQSVIQKLGKPWYGRRALRVFRDDTSLSATPGLWPSIEQALADSRFLILLASPEAAASPWVNKEVAYWLEHKNADTLLIAVTEGELSWDNALGDFVWRECMPLPPVLARRFVTEPKWVDLTGLRESADARNAKFIEAGADFAAAIHGLPKEDLLSQEVLQQRRALALAWSATAVLLVLAGIAGWQAKVALDNEHAAIEQRSIAEKERSLAQQQRDRAERTLVAATKTANSLVFNLAREFRDRAGMPRDLVRGILTRAQELQWQLAESESGEGAVAYELRRSMAVTLIYLADTFLEIGDAVAALAAAQQSRTIMEELVAVDHNTLWWFDLSLSHDRIGSALIAAGRLAEALLEYRRGLAIQQKFAAVEPANTAWQSGQASSHDRIGDVLFAQGQRQDALVEYRRSLAIREILVAAAPADNEWQRALSTSYGRVGNALTALGRRQDALIEYRRSLAIAEKLVGADPGNIRWQRDLSFRYFRIGDLLSDAGRWAEALAEYRRSLAITEKLAAADRGNADLQEDLSVRYERVGTVLNEMGRAKEALVEYRRSLAIREKLAAAEPGNSGRQADLLIAFYKISLVSEPAEARAALLKALTMAEALAQANKLAPAQQNWQKIFREALGKLPPESTEAQ